MRRQAAFTLIEVMVAFAILSGLLTLILQTQGEQARFLARSQVGEQVLQELQTQILAQERGDSTTAWPANEGSFPQGHPLAGFRYRKEFGQEMFLGQFPLNKITLSIHWDEGKHPQSYAASFFTN